MIAAIVVTYNRKQLLIKCLDAICSQLKRPDKIFIIDNNSTDGTDCSVINGLKINTQYIKLPINTGAAGGFHEGLLEAFKQGYEWFWLMDDDGLPEQSCLSSLIKVAKFDMAISPISLAYNSSTDLSIPASLNGKEIILTSENLKKYAKDDVILGWSCFYHGTLFNKVLIEKVGLPKYNMFIWGDEEEYQIRMKAMGFRLATAQKAIFHHPAERRSWESIVLGKKTASFERSWRIFCYLRNQSYISRKYSRSKGLGFFLMQTYYFIIKRNSVTEYVFFLRAFIDGWMDRYKIKVPF